MKNRRVGSHQYGTADSIPIPFDSDSIPIPFDSDSNPREVKMQREQGRRCSCAWSSSGHAAIIKKWDRGRVGSFIWDGIGQK